MARPEGKPGPHTNAAMVLAAYGMPFSSLRELAPGMLALGPWEGTPLRCADPTTLLMAANEPSSGDPRLQPPRIVSLTDRPS